MSEDTTKPDSQQAQAVVSWLNSAPEQARNWLRGIAHTRCVADQLNFSFQAPGKYDGAMSEECKQLFREKYAFLKVLSEWIEKPGSRTSSERLK